MTVLPNWISRLKLPVIAAPMFLTSGVALVNACRAAGIVGTFPAANARSAEELESWFDRIEVAATPEAQPFGVNLVLARKDVDPLVETTLKRRPPIVITSVGQPTEIVKRVHAYGGLVFHDVTTVRHAEKAAEAGVDGIIAVCAGAGGHAGAVSPFALVPQVRTVFAGLVIVGGAISEGSAILSAEALGADLVYMGSRFLATAEAMAQQAYKELVVAAETKDIVYTPSISGLPASFIRQSIEAAGLDPANLPRPLGLHHADLPPGIKAWRDIWSAGQGTGLIRDIPDVGALIDRLAVEYDAARAALALRTARRTGGV